MPIHQPGRGRSFSSEICKNLQKKTVQTSSPNWEVLFGNTLPPWRNPHRGSHLESADAGRRAGKIPLVWSSGWASLTRARGSASPHWRPTRSHSDNTLALFKAHLNGDLVQVHVYRTARRRTPTYSPRSPSSRRGRRSAGSWRRTLSCSRGSFRATPSPSRRRRHSGRPRRDATPNSSSAMRLPPVQTAPCSLAVQRRHPSSPVCLPELHGLFYAAPVVPARCLVMPGRPLLCPVFN